MHKLIFRQWHMLIEIKRRFILKYKFSFKYFDKRQHLYMNFDYTENMDCKNILTNIRLFIY